MQGQTLRSMMVTSFIDVLTRSCSRNITNDSLNLLMQFVRRSDFKRRSYRGDLGTLALDLNAWASPTFAAGDVIYRRIDEIFGSKNHK